MEDVKWAENVIIADADYADHVAFDLTVNFERMLGRRVPPADLALWAECLALDGGLKEGEHETQVVLVHSRDRQRLENFVPADYQNELNGQACRGRLGELAFTAVQTEELAGKDDLLLDILIRSREFQCKREDRVSKRTGHMQAGVNRYIRPRSTDILRLVTKEVFQVSRHLILGRDVKLGIFGIAG